jgi:uncharacterized delta-60 repeat protein
MRWHLFLKDFVDKWRLTEREKREKMKMVQNNAPKEVKMKKQVTGLLFIVCFIVFSFAQVDTAWIRRYGSSGYEEVKCLAVDNNGNVVIGGSNGFPLVLKYNSSGVLQWVRIYTDTLIGSGVINAITVDDSGNIYATGECYGYTTNRDFITIKYSSNGVQQWVAKYNGPINGSDYANDITIDRSGNVYITGTSATNQNLPYNDPAYLTIKYNKNGIQQWVARYNPPPGPDWCFDEARAIAIDNLGNVYVTGYSWGEGIGGTRYDYATVKYNNAGVQQWVRRYDYFDDEAVDLAVDRLGNIYVTGSSGVYKNDYLTIKYTPAGDTVWTRRYRGENEDLIAKAIAVDDSSNVYITGYSYGKDYLTVKYTSTGIEKWGVRYNGPGDSTDHAYSLAVDKIGNVYVTGISYGGSTAEDYATVKYNSTGIQQWVVRYNGVGNGYDGACSIAIDSLGNIYVTGISYSANPEIVTIKYIPVIPRPRIQIRPERFEITIQLNQIKDTVLQISNTGQANLSWHLTEIPQVPWLSESETTGIIPPDSQKNIFLTFNSRNLSRGTYLCTLRVRSNDSTTPEINIPVSFRVVAPEISFSQKVFDFGSVHPGVCEIRILHIKNKGDDSLKIDSAITSFRVFSVPSPTFPQLVPPQESLLVILSFDPPGFEYYSGKIFFYSNDPAASKDSIFLYGIGGIFGGLKGIVFDRENNHPVPDAFIYFGKREQKLLDNYPSKVPTSGPNGEFSVNMPVGIYEIEITKAGYLPFRFSGILVSPNQMTYLDTFDLVPETTETFHWKTCLGEFQGVVNYSNYQPPSPQPRGCYGLLFECVEFVNRFYAQSLWHRNMTQTGNAKDYFPTASQRGLIPETNAVTPNPPQPGDILCWDGTSGNPAGHVAIVRSVVTIPPDDEWNDTVYVIQQNIRHNYSDVNTPILMMRTSNGRYRVQNRYGPTQGWLRKPDLPPNLFEDIIFVDDNWTNKDGSQFIRFGDSSTWRRYSGRTIGASRGSAWYFPSRQTNEINAAIWRPNLPYSDNYEVFVFIPDSHATTTNARYEIFHRDGVAQVTINQQNISGVYTSLGIFPFWKGTTGYVRLSDVTGEIDKEIGVDAMLFVRRPSAISDKATQGRVETSKRSTISLIVPSLFRQQVSIRYSLAEKGEISLQIFDASGQLVQILANGVKEAGLHSTNWDARNMKGEKFNAGIFFCVLVTKKERVQRKILLVK